MERPTNRQIGYITSAACGVPTASERGTNQKWPTSDGSQVLCTLHFADGPSALTSFLLENDTKTDRRRGYT